MATITTNAYVPYDRSLSLDVWETGAYDATASTRQYGWKLRGSGTGTSWCTSGNFKALVGGNQVYFSSTRIQLYPTTVVAEGTVWVQHDNAGNKYVDMYCEAGIYNTAVNCTASGGFQGTVVPRYANITAHSLYHIGINKVGVSWTADSAIDWLQYSLNDGAWTDTSGNPYYIGGLTPATAYNIRTRVRRTDSGLWTESGYLYFTTIAAGTITGGDNFTDEGNGYMTYSNAWGNNVQELLGGLYWNGSEALQAYGAISKTGSNYTFTLTEAERAAMRSRMANVNSMNIIYHIRTQSENTYYYSTLTKQITIVNAKPVLGDFSYQDTNTVTKNLTGSDQKIIKGRSNLRIYGITATTLKAATKKTVMVDGVGAAWSDTYEKTINGYSKNTIGVSMTDSRDNTADIMTKIFSTYIDYFDITKGEQSSLRGSSGVGETVTLVAKGTWFNGSFGAVTNTLTATYRYKKTGNSTWITGTTPLTITNVGNNFTINQDIVGDIAAGFTINDSYDLEVILIDKLSTVTFKYTILPGSPAISIFGNKIALGGKFDESDTNAIQIRKSVAIIGELLANNGYVSKHRGSVSNFNDCLTEGVYAVEASNLTGAPYTGDIYGKLLVYVSDATTHNNSSNWIWQKFMNTAGIEYRRNKVNSGAWTSWINAKLDSYPVGTIYENAIDSTSPATLFGGTWVQLTDRVLVGAGNSYGLGTTFGANSVTLTVAQLAQHSHYVSLGGGDHNHTGRYRAGAASGNLNFLRRISDEDGYTGDAVVTYWNGSHTHSGNTNNTGSNEAHENRQPSRAVYQWYRSA